MLREWTERLRQRLDPDEDAWRRAQEPVLPIDDLPPPPPQHPARADAQSRARARAAVVEALNPAVPVASRGQLLGREVELASIFAAISDLRGHALVHGSRGAGKTSIARAFGDYADERGLLVIYLSCDGGSAGFAELFRPYLDFIPAYEADTQAAIAALPATFGPRALAGVFARLSGQRIVLIVDEFDRVTDPATRADIATLVKALTDLHAPVHLLLVGIARDAHELVLGHPSLRRHLTAVALRPFGHDSANRLLDEAERAAGLVFDAEARALVTGLAAGSPYHLRLFAFSAAIAAVERGERTVSAAILCESLPQAFANWAALNPVAAALFERLARESAPQRRRLEALALATLHADVLTVDALDRRIENLGQRGAGGGATDLIDRVRPALAEIGGGGGSGGGYVFEDTLAPQFLLLACCLAERGDGMTKRNAA